jgi:hypothetical protein
MSRANIKHQRRTLVHWRAVATLIATYKEAQIVASRLRQPNKGQQPTSGALLIAAFRRLRLRAARG